MIRRRGLIIDKTEKVGEGVPGGMTKERGSVTSGIKRVAAS